MPVRLFRSQNTGSVRPAFQFYPSFYGCAETAGAAVLAAIMVHFNRPEKSLSRHSNEMYVSIFYDEGRRERACAKHYKWDSIAGEGSIRN